MTDAGAQLGYPGGEGNAAARGIAAERRAAARRVPLRRRVAAASAR